MKYLRHITVICIFFTFYSCSHQPVTVIGNLNNCDSEIFIRNWELTKPYVLDSYMANSLDTNFNYLNNRDQGDNIADYYSFTKLFDNLQHGPAKKDAPDFSRFICHMPGSYIQVDTFFNSYDDKPKACYAAANIKSDVQQDVAVFAGASMGLQIWVNQTLVLKKLNKDPINGYEYPLKVHLNKGDNFILAKLTNTSGDWKFFLKTSSVKYAIENSLGTNFSSICKNYLIPRDSDLTIKVWSPFIPLQKSLQVKITDQHNNIILNNSFGAGKPVKLQLKKYQTGPYSVELKTGSFTLNQKIFYGDYHQYFNSLERNLKPFLNAGKFKGNITILFDRFNYTDTVNVAHDNGYERKVANNLFELTAIFNRLSRHIEAFKDVPGLHIRAQDNDDHKADSYMVYIPEKYNKSKPIPLLVMMPHETGIRHFNISTYVSDINRIEHICKLANKYGMGILWSSFKVYNHHNLTNMIPRTVFETVNDVRKDYNIDTTRLYAYGDCAGGELALFTANRYPSYFAAVAVEGPAIPNSSCDDAHANCLYQSNGAISADFYNTIENYKNFPVCIFHSTLDEKADIERSKKLTKLVSSIGGHMQLREIPVKKGSDRFYFFMNLMPDNNVLTNMFKFYDGKRIKSGDTVNLATWELKYNKAYWLTIDGKTSGKKAIVEAIANAKNNEVAIKARNITRLTLNLAELAKIHINKNLKLLINGQVVKNFVLNGNHLTATLLPVKISPYIKNEYTEGPQNDFFSSPFMIVRGTKGSFAACRNYAAAIDTFKANWETNFLEDTCRIKNDVDITEGDISRYNLILIGTEKTNALLKRMAPGLPLEIKPDQIVIANKKYEGNDLSFSFVHPNPLNKKRYVLIGAGNAPVFYAGILKDIFFNGWSDYIINAKGYTLASGCFNSRWQ